MARRWHGNSTDYFSESAKNNALDRRLDALEDKVNNQGGSTLTAPEPCIPDYALAYTAKKGRLRLTGCATVPIGSQVIGTILIADQYDNVDQDTFDRNVLTDERDIDPDASAAGHVEYQFMPLLDFETAYNLKRLVVTDDSGGRVRNPAGPLLFTSPSLATFTTPADAEAPNRPHVGNIIENNLDDSTTRQFDVWLSVQIIAPASASNSLTGTVGVTTDSTTVTGSGTSFTTGISVGNGIEVNGETHIVTNVASNTSLTVDFPFKQTTASGQSATRKVLHTFESAGITAVAPKFRATTDSEGKAISPHFAIDETDSALTNVKVKVLGFGAAKTYNYVHNVAIGVGERHTSSPLTTQTFTAGNFTTPTANIPEWGTAPFFQYDATDPQNDNKRDVSLRITEISPPVGKDKIDLYRRNTGTGTISSSGTTVTGSGTLFLAEVAKGHFIIVGSETVEVANVSTNTSLTLVTAPSSPFPGGSAWTKSVLKYNQTLQIGKFHPSAGGLLPPIKFGEIKTKRLVAYTYAAVITALNGVTRTITDTFTPDGEESEDTGVPLVLSDPQLVWSAEGKMKIVNMQATYNIHTRKEVYVVVTDNAGIYMNLADGTTAFNELAGRYKTGNKGHITLDWIKLKKYKNVFGASANVYAYYYVENDLGTSAASNLSTAINLAVPYDFMDGATDTVGGLAPGTKGDSNVQILYNGHFTYGTATDAQLWLRRDSATWATTNPVNTTNTNAIYWDKSNHRAVWQEESDRLTSSLGKRQVPGDYYTAAILVKSNGTPTVDIKCLIRDNAGNNDTADDNDSTATPTATVTLSSTYQTVIWRFRLKTTADASVKHHLSFETSTNINSSNQIIIDAVMVVRGKSNAAFSFHPKDQNNAGGGDEDFDVTAAATGVTPDLGNPVGVPGGLPPIGEGDPVSIPSL